MGKGIKNACVRKMGVGPLASNLTTHDTLNLSRTIDSFTWVVRTFPLFLKLGILYAPQQVVYPFTMPTNYTSKCKRYS